MSTEICKRCGGSGSNHNLIKPGSCPVCLGKGTVDYEEIVKGYRKMIRHHQKFSDEFQTQIDTIRNE